MQLHVDSFAKFVIAPTQCHETNFNSPHCSIDHVTRNDPSGVSILLCFGSLHFLRSTTFSSLLICVVVFMDIYISASSDLVVDCTNSSLNVPELSVSYPLVCADRWCAL